MNFPPIKLAGRRGAEAGREISADRRRHHRDDDEIDAIPIEKVVAETPESGHGETDERPIPAPKAMRMRVMAQAATAPAATEAQDTAEK